MLAENSTRETQPPETRGRRRWIDLSAVRPVSTSQQCLRYYVVCADNRRLSLNLEPNVCSFSSHLSHPKSYITRTEAGKLFQNCGPTTSNDPSPSRVLVCGMKNDSWYTADERRGRCGQNAGFSRRPPTRRKYQRFCYH